MKKFSTPMKRWYASAIDANGKRQSVSPFICATSIPKAMARCKEIYPPEKGYTGHHITRKHGGYYGN